MCMKIITKTYGLSVKSETSVAKPDRVDWLSQSAMPSSTHSCKVITVSKKTEFSIFKSRRR